MMPYVLIFGTRVLLVGTMSSNFVLLSKFTYETRLTKNSEKHVLGYPSGDAFKVKYGISGTWSFL